MPKLQENNLSNAMDRPVLTKPLSAECLQRLNDDSMWFTVHIAVLVDDLLIRDKSGFDLFLSKLVVGNHPFRLWDISYTPVSISSGKIVLSVEAFVDKLNKYGACQ